MVIAARVGQRRWQYSFYCYVMPHSGSCLLVAWDRVQNHVIVGHKIKHVTNWMLNVGIKLQEMTILITDINTCGFIQYISQ